MGVVWQGSLGPIFWGNEAGFEGLGLRNWMVSVSRFRIQGLRLRSSG